MTAQENILIGKIKSGAHGRTPLMDIVRAELDEELSIDRSGQYLLWMYNGWRPVSFVDVMRRFNKRRLERGARQITSNPQWEVTP